MFELDDIELVRDVDSIDGDLLPGVELFEPLLSAKNQRSLLEWLSSHWAEARHFGPGKLSKRGGAKFLLSGSREEDELPFPDWGYALAGALKVLGFFAAEPNFLYVVRYDAPEGMAPHEDRDMYGDTVAGFTIGSVSLMTVQETNGTRGCRLLLKPGSLYILGPQVRRGFLHGIAGGFEFSMRGKRYVRGQRYAITFRQMLRRDEQ